jgi:phosphohistidine phosphatase
MREVLLVRHGKAAVDAPGGDAARPLTDEGRKGIEAVGRGLAAFGFRPDVLWHSPYVRATETGQILARALSVGNVVAEGAITPMSSAERAAQAIVESTARCLVVVSHMPLLPALAAELVGARIDFGTGTVAHLAVLGHHGSALLGLWTADHLARVR